MLKIALAGRFRESSSNGIDRTIEGHIVGMVDRGYQVTLLTTENPGSQEKERLEEWGVRVACLSRNPLKYFFQCLKFRNEFDLLSLHSVFTPLNWLVSMALDCPRILTPNGGYSPKQIEYRGHFKKRIALSFYERRMLERSLFVQVLSENERKQLGLVAPEAETVIVPNGFDSALVPERAMREPAECIRLLFIGRVALMHKGLDLLARALAGMKSNVDWDLKVVGPAEEGAIEVLENLVRGSSAENRIHFLGPIYGDEKNALYNEADIFVHTSRYEGMPFSVIEALSYGLPVLVTPGTNMADLIEGYEAGWTIASEVLPEEIVRVIESPGGEFPKKAKNAQRLVREELSWEKINETLFSAVEERIPSHS